MNVYEFSTIGYFMSHYFNWSMDYSDLENCIDDFLMSENIAGMIMLLYSKTQEDKNNPI